MKTLITSDDVLRIAYSPEELIPSAIILDVDIVEAESRYITPVLGETLTTTLRSGNYAALMTDYVAPALATWIRYGIEQVAYRRSAACHNEHPTTADNARLRTTLHALRNKASTLTRRLSDYLNANSVNYPEYNPGENPLNHCFIYGDIIQIY